MDKKTQMDNTLELKDLVYAPLRAASDANIRLSAGIVDFLASTGDLSRDANGKAVVQLKTIQMLYEQLRTDSMDNTVADSIGLEVPLLSIYPLSSLKISKTKVAFDAEIRSFSVTDGDVKIYTQVCAKNERDGANQARVSYKIELDSAPISEGLARFIDTLNTQAIPKLMSSKPVDNSGRRLSGTELEEYERQAEFRARENKLLAKLNDLKELTRAKNNALKLETGMDFDEYRDHIAYLEKSGETAAIPEAYSEIKEYQEISAGVEARLDKLRRRMVFVKINEGADAENGTGGGERQS
jgi:hypothetical protein